MNYIETHKQIAKETGIDPELVHYIRSKMLGCQMDRHELYRHMRKNARENMKLAMPIMEALVKKGVVHGDGHSSSARHLRDLLSKNIRNQEWSQTLKFISNKQLAQVLREVK